MIQLQQPQNGVQTTPQQQQPHVNAYGEPILASPPMLMDGNLLDISDF
jgi:hypothetical protein